ncbi:hypothetical protein R3P38DRAFT_3253382 [Favolaschia claudopus]|uniref:Uncharacterized protein n=1 Tax=Favolaschia claudopus TaxID=2862362 RepID=A0AAW0DVG7_9AGAR
MSPPSRSRHVRRYQPRESLRRCHALHGLALYASTIASWGIPISWGKLLCALCLLYQLPRPRAHAPRRCRSDLCSTPGT